MSTTNSIANPEIDLQGLLSRVKVLETDLAQLKQKSTDASNSNSDRAHRWERVRGSMKDDPEFAEVLRLGREYRKSHFTE